MEQKTDLMELLRAREKNGTKQAEDLVTALGEWVADLKLLCDKIRGWLAEAEAQGLVSFNVMDVEVSEEGMSAYQAPALDIVLKDGVVVHVRPVGMKIIGARGRVDIFTEGREIRLLRRGTDDWVFQISWAGPRGKHPPLNEDTFKEAFSDLIDQGDFQPGE